MILGVSARRREHVPSSASRAGGDKFGEVQKEYRSIQLLQRGEEYHEAMYMECPFCLRF